MDGRLHLATVRRSVAAVRCRIVRAMHFDNLALFVFHYAVRSDEVAVAQAHFASRREAEIFWRRHFAEIVLLDIQLAREWNLPRTGTLVLGIVSRVHLLDLAFGIIVDH